MRLGLIVYGSLDNVSGGYLYDRHLVERLRADGHAVEIVSLPWRGYLRHLGDNISAALLAWLARADYEVLLEDELNHPSLVWLNRRLQRRVAYPIVAIVHHLRLSEAQPGWQRRLVSWVERRYLASVDGFVFNSQTTRQTVESLAGASRPAVVAPPGADRLAPPLTLAAIEARVRQTTRLEVLFVGNVIARKGLHALIGALARLADLSWQLTVVGSLATEPAYTRRVKRLLHQTGLAERVTFAGQLSDKALRLRLAGSHVLAVPSSYEGYGIVYAEALGFGLPVIAGTAGAAHEIVTDGQEGFLIAPGDGRSLGASLERLMTDHDLLLTMSRRARQRHAALPTWAATTGAISDFLTRQVRAHAVRRR